MHMKLMSCGVAVLAAVVLAACGATGSGSSTSHATTSTPATTAASSSTTTASTATATTTAAARVHGRTLTTPVGGSGAGRPVTLASLKTLKRVHRSRTRAHVNGLQGLSLTQKLATLITGVASFWQASFQQSGGQLPAANAVLVADQPASCGSTQITAASAPEYCPTNATINLPLGTITSNIEPLGDSALLLLVSDLYGYHVENAIGAFSHGLNGAQLEEMDSCFSGVYFYYAEAQGALEPTDEEGVNRLLAVLAPAAGTSAKPGSVTASELATAFNKGILSNLNPVVCVPKSAG